MVLGGDGASGLRCVRAETNGGFDGAQALLVLLHAVAHRKEKRVSEGHEKGEDCGDTGRCGEI